MFVPDNNLNHWRYVCSVLHVAIQQAQAELVKSQKVESQQEPGKGQEAKGLETVLLLLDQTAAAVLRMGLGLEQAGAMKPGEMKPSEDGCGGIQAMAEDIPLHLLNTAANRHYLSTLVEALNAATAVDQERYGDTTRVYGCAYMIEAIMRETLGEIIPPSGRVPE